MATRTESTQRVQRLHREFMQYHKKGHTVLEIAKICNVDFSTVYKHLQQIADENGVTRESLLQQPTSSYSSRSPIVNDKLDIEKLRADFDSVEKGIDEILNTIKNFTAKE